MIHKAGNVGCCGDLPPLLPGAPTASCCGPVQGTANAIPQHGDARGRDFRVAGLDCAEEVAILGRVLGPEIGGPDHLAFDVINGRMTILESARPISDDRVAEVVAATGMRARRWNPETASADYNAHLLRQTRFAGASAVFWAAGIAYHLVETGWGGLPTLFAGHGGTPMPLFEVICFGLAVMFGAWLVAPKAWSAARRLSPDMNLLMMVAVTGAIALGEIFEAATVAFLFALSLALESWSVGRARDAVSALLDLAPPLARVLSEEGEETEHRAASVPVGSRFLVRAGDRIPLDGNVIEGSGAVDQAPITGESALQLKEPGDPVYAGTVNGDGTLIVRSTRQAGDTVLARIIRMVSDAHARRAPVEQWVSKFARIYTPVVMGLALAVALIPPLVTGGGWDTWIYKGLVLLVIACPCALVISTPVSIVASLAASARHGVLIKGGAFVEAPAHTTAIALDKTGTLTFGEPEVAAIHPMGPVTQAELLAVAAALEKHSSHPLARAIRAAATARGMNITAARDTRSLPGRGIEGHLDGRRVWLGSDRFATEKGFHDTVPDEVRAAIAARGSTFIAVGADNSLLGVVEMRDRIRPQARSIIEALHRRGVARIVMLTGDAESAAQAVAREVGIDEVRAELLPDDKVAAVEELAGQYARVAMIGDGVNDAPAMARAHYAIAMGAVGSDAAIETADIALMTDDISRVPWLIDQSRRTMTIIRQNIAISLVTKLFFVGLAALDFAVLWGAIAADVGVSLLVVANALRLLRDHP